MTPAPTWSIEHEVRDDADSVFVPADLLPLAQPGDTVELTSGSDTTRAGRVLDIVQDDVRGAFVTVKLD